MIGCVGAPFDGGILLGQDDGILHLVNTTSRKDNYVQKTVRFKPFSLIRTDLPISTCICCLHIAASPN